MGKIFDDISPDLATWIREQPMFVVATAPLASDGHVNCSPKGLDTLRIVGPREVAYLDLTGSGAETIAHLRENGRIVFMFCAVSGPPKIVRLHGTGSVCLPGSPDWDRLRTLFPPYPGVRSIIRAEVTRVSDSCGYSVPKLAFVEERDTLLKWAEKKSPEELTAYKQQKNARSIDGLPGLSDGEA